MVGVVVVYAGGEQVLGVVEVELWQHECDVWCVAEEG